MMKLRFLALLLTLGCAGAQAAAIQAELSFESTSVDVEGITRTYSYRDTLIRDEGHLWIQRQLPAQPAQVHAKHDPHEHEDLNIFTRPRMIVPADAGAATLWVIDPELKRKVLMDISTYEMAGFSGQWAAEYSLLDPQRLGKMKRVARPDVPAGKQWYEDQRGEFVARVLWNEALQLPEIIESSRIDGRASSTTHLKLQTPPAVLPWQQLDGYQEIEFSDLGD